MSCDLYLTCFLTKGSTLICCSPWFLWVLMLVSARRNESSEVLEKQIYIYLLRILNSISCHNSFLIHNSSHAFHNPFNSVFFLSLWTINMGEKIKQNKKPPIMWHSIKIEQIRLSMGWNSRWLVFLVHATEEHFFIICQYV